MFIEINNLKNHHVPHIWLVNLILLILLFIFVLQQRQNFQRENFLRLKHLDELVYFLCVSVFVTHLVHYMGVQYCLPVVLRAELLGSLDLSVPPSVYHRHR